MRADHEKIRRLIYTARGQLDGILKIRSQGHEEAR